MKRRDLLKLTAAAPLTSLIGLGSAPETDPLSMYVNFLLDDSETYSVSVDHWTYHLRAENGGYPPGGRIYLDLHNAKVPRELYEQFVPDLLNGSTYFDVELRIEAPKEGIDYSGILYDAKVLTVSELRNSGAPLIDIPHIGFIAAPLPPPPPPDPDTAGIFRYRRNPCPCPRCS